MPPRKKYDWDIIKKDYETGQFNSSELERIHGPKRQVIDRKAKKEGWTRDLSSQVRQKARGRLVLEDAKEALNRQAIVEGADVPFRESSKGAPAPNDAPIATPSDEETIALAAEVRIQVVTGHRELLSRLQKSTQEMLSNLECGHIVLAHKEDGTQIKEPLTVKDRTAMLNAASMTVARLIPLERQAFNLDEERSADPLNDLLKEIEGNTRDLIAYRDEALSE